MGIVIAIVILVAVIMFHELGHFALAKACHIRVKEFAFGMGPIILGFQKEETLYTWRLVPIGGMCVMEGENDEEITEGSFQAAKVWQRILVVAAGPIFNFILAFIIALIVIFSVGADVCTVAAVSEDSNALSAGLTEGDLILSYEGHSISNARELYMYIYMDGLPEDNIDLVVERDGEKIEVSFALDETEVYRLGFSYEDAGNAIEVSYVSDGYPMAASGIEAGDIITAVNGYRITSSTDFQGYLSDNPLSGDALTITFARGRIDYGAEVTPVVSVEKSGGFSYNMAREKQGILTGVKYAFGEIKYWVNTTIKSLAGLLSGMFGLEDLSGPVGIVTTVDSLYEEASSDGLLTVVMSMLNIAILISANLGIMNLLPLPALDGGRLIFLFIECIRRKRCNQRIEAIVHLVGIVALLALAAVVAFNDVLKLF